MRRFAEKRQYPTAMLHPRHTSAIHAEVPRFMLWLQVIAVLASVAALWLARICRRG